MIPFFQEHLGELAALGTALLWSFSALAWTSAGRRIGSLAVNFNRLVISFLLLSIYCRFQLGTWLPSGADSKTWRMLLLSGVVGFFFADVCGFKALLILGPRLMLLLLATMPPLTAILAIIFLNDTMKLYQWFAMAVTLAGVAWVVLEQQESPKETHHRKDFGWGVFLALASSAFAAIGSVLSKEGIGEYDAFAATMIRIIGALICFLPVLFYGGRWRQIGRSMLQGRTMLIVLFGSIVGPVVGVAFSLIALRLCSAGVAMTLINTMPVMILPLVVVFYKEKVSPRAAIGAVISVVGVAMLMK